MFSQHVRARNQGARPSLRRDAISTLLGASSYSSRRAALFQEAVSQSPVVGPASQARGGQGGRLPVMLGRRSEQSLELGIGIKADDSISNKT